MQELILDILIQRYGEFTPIKLTGGYTNETYHLKRTNPPLVAKIGRSTNGDIGNELRCLQLLKDRSSVPVVYEALAYNDYHVTIMEFRQGVNGQSILDQNDLSRTRELYKEMAQSLASDIHSVKYSLSNDGIRKFGLDQIDFSLDFVPAELVEKSQEYLHIVKNQREGWVLTHGDFGIHNILYDQDLSVTLLDWEWAEWGSPLLDVAWVCWFTGLHYPKYAEELNSIFLENYLRYNSVAITPELLKGYSLYKVWKILQKVKYASKEVQNEWVRRLKWTIETKVFEGNAWRKYKT